MVTSSWGTSCCRTSTREGTTSTNCHWWRSTRRCPPSPWWHWLWSTCQVTESDIIYILFNINSQFSDSRSEALLVSCLHRSLVWFRDYHPTFARDKFSQRFTPIYWHCCDKIVRVLKNDVQQLSKFNTNNKTIHNLFQKWRHTSVFVGFTGELILFLICICDIIEHLCVSVLHSGVVVGLWQLLNIMNMSSWALLNTDEHLSPCSDILLTKQLNDQFRKESTS